MNKVCMTGRLTAKPELRYNTNNIAYTRFTLAVNRKFTNENGQREADFISCIGWKKIAEIICEHFNKGSQIGIQGRIQTGSYDAQDGTKKYTTDVVIEDITFLDKKTDSRPEPEYPGQQNNLYNQKNDSIDEDPFADFGESVSIDDNFLD